MKNRDEVLNRLAEAITCFDIDGVKRAAQEALDNGIDPLEAVKEGMAKGMEAVGQKYEQKEYFLSELLMAGEAMKAGLEILSPYLKTSRVRDAAKVVIGTVQGDIHDIGKSIVSTLLSSAGFDVYDLGVDVPTERFISKVKEVEADVLGLSALLSTTMPNMKNVIDAVISSGLRDRVVIIVGGAPVTQDYAKSIDADLYAPDAVIAVEALKKYMRSRQRFS